MRPTVGWGLGGPVLSPRDRDGRARLGEPNWGPGELLRDLHLRLGLPFVDAPASVRLPQWVNRMRAVADEGAFYARSFRVDALGTASTLLAWRDALVDAGWDGKAVAGGGDRLVALAALEARKEIELPPGTGDRLARIEEELRKATGRVYETLSLLEPRDLWSRRWQRVFLALEARGTRVVASSFEVSGAPASTDLGVLQRLLRDESLGAASPASAVRGDGTLLVLRGETPAEVAAFTAGMLARDPKDAVVVRCIDTASLEAALVRQGLAAQGHTGASAARPAMQILPLALELAYEPRDPYRALELLTLPVGPFRGLVGTSLARAVSKQPGVGGQEWMRQREVVANKLRAIESKRHVEAGASPEAAAAAAAAHVETQLARVAEWIEARGAGPEGATRSSLLELATRVRTWLQKRLVREEDRPIYAAAYAQAQAFDLALASDARERLTHEDARHLLETIARVDEAHAISQERAGRIAHVAQPDGILASVGTLVVWGFVASVAKKPRLLPWNRAERAALAGAGVTFPDPGKLLQADAASWRRAVLAARERVVFVIPSTLKGEPMSPHPVWDEIAARLSLDESSTRQMTRHVRAALENAEGDLADVAALPPLDLPDARDVWRVAPELLKREGEDERGLYATALEKLASCPLAWVLDQRANVRSGAVAKVAEGPLLNGNLSHRLVEELHREGAFARPELDFLARVEGVLARLIETEGATLLLPGATFERSQLQIQIAKALRALWRYLEASGFTIAAVEENIEIDSIVGRVTGRLDVRLADADGEPAVLDLKWGASSYGALLKEGRAVQLAIYARALRDKRKKRLPPAAYFAIGGGKVLTTDERMKADRVLDGAPLDETWSGLEQTVAAVMKKLGRGEVYVARQKNALPLLGALGVPEGQHATHYQAKDEAPCKYCAYGSLCGRAWEGLK